MKRTYEVKFNRVVVQEVTLEVAADDIQDVNKILDLRKRGQFLVDGSTGYKVKTITVQDIEKEFIPHQIYAIRDGV